MNPTTETTPTKSRRFAVVGAGAVGSVMAWRLANAGASVLLVGRGERLAAIERTGLRLTDHQQDRACFVQACTDTQGEAPREIIILATKAQDLSGALETAKPLIGPDSVVIPAVNGIPWWYFKGAGVDAERPILRIDPNGVLWAALQQQQIIGAVVHWGASINSAGEVLQSPQPRLVLGELDGVQSERIQAIAAVFEAGGLPTTVDSRIRDAVWSKLLGNIATNPLSVVTGATLDRLFNEVELAQLVRAQMAEVMAVGLASGARFEQDIDSRIDIGRKLGSFKTSMLQDFERGRPLEMAAIAEVVLDMAREMGMPMPVTRMIATLALAAEKSMKIARKGQDD